MFPERYPVVIEFAVTRVLKAPADDTSCYAPSPACCARLARSTHSCAMFSFIRLVSGSGAALARSEHCSALALYHWARVRMLITRNCLIVNRSGFIGFPARRQLPLRHLQFDIVDRTPRPWVDLGQAATGTSPTCRVLTRHPAISSAPSPRVWLDTSGWGH
jgi:hypothetical protein